MLKYSTAYPIHRQTFVVREGRRGEGDLGRWVAVAASDDDAWQRPVTRLTGSERGGLAAVEALLSEVFTVRRFQHSVHVSLPRSDLRVQIQTDPRYAAFPERAAAREVLGLRLPVASVEDVLRGKT